MAGDDLERAAAELALGLTPIAERPAALAREAREPAFARAVAVWEKLLAPLSEVASPDALATPSAELIDVIEQRIDAAGAAFPGCSGSGL